MFRKTDRQKDRQTEGQTDRKVTLVSVFVHQRSEIKMDKELDNPLLRTHLSLSHN